MQANKFTTLVELSAQLGADGELYGVRLKSMFVDPTYKEDKSGPNSQNTVKFDCLCCNLNYVISVKVEKEQKPVLNTLEIYPEGEPKALEEVRIDGSPKIKEENPLEETSEAEDNFEPLLNESEAQVRELPNPLQCSYCFQIMKNAQYLSQHVSKHISFVCDYCSVVVEGKQRLQNHFVVEHRKGLECSICGEIYSNKATLALHQRTHSTKTFKCAQCAFETRHPDSLRRHGRLHTGEKRTEICHVCGKIYTEKGNLRAHIRRVHKIQLETTQNKPKRQLKQSRPSAKWTARGKAAAEKETNETKEFRCQDCSRTYATYLALYSHRYICHLKKGVKRFFCTECDRAFPWLSELNQHVKAVHRKEPIRCNYCGGLYSCNASLRRHVNAIHTKAKKYECEHCAKVFFARTSRDNHRRTHTGEKYSCPYCPRQIADAGSFYRHKKQHQLADDEPLESAVG